MEKTHKYTKYAEFPQCKTPSTRYVQYYGSFLHIKIHVQSKRSVFLNMFLVLL